MQCKYVCVMTTESLAIRVHTYNSSPDGNPLSTASNRIRDIFNISAGEKVARRREHTRSNAEFGIGT